MKPPEIDYKFYICFLQPSLKKLIIADQVRDIFASNDMVLVFQFTDMDTANWEDLRFALRKDDIKAKMLPNKVTCKALENTMYREMAPLFLAATFVTYSKEANVRPLLAAVKKQPKVELLGGKIDNQLLSRKSVIEYSKLPSLTELHGQLVQLLLEPSRRLSSALQQNQLNLSVNLSQYVRQGDNA